MSDENKKKDASQPGKETFFLPPLKMILAFFDKESRQREKQKKETKEEKTVEKNVEKLIEKLSEEEEE